MEQDSQPDPTNIVQHLQLRLKLLDKANYALQTLKDCKFDDREEGKKMFEALYSFFKVAEFKHDSS